MSGHVDEIAAIIRRVDGSHSLGASALAEALVENGVALRAKVAEEIGAQF